MTDPARRTPLPDQISGPGVIAIARRLPGERMAALVGALLEGGVHALEITLDGAEALASIEQVTSRHAAGELLVGAGTVLDRAAAADAVAAGAGFLVSPHLDPDIVGWAVERSVAVLPGAYSPTEILAAWRAGASAVKLFPASAVGPSFLREVRGPLREIPLVPTGGLTAESAGAFVAAGAAAVGLGGWLIGDGEPVGVADRARAAVASVAAARAGRTGSG